MSETKKTTTPNASVGADRADAAIGAETGH